MIEGDTIHLKSRAAGLIYEARIVEVTPDGAFVILQSGGSRILISCVTGESRYHNFIRVTPLTTDTVYRFD